MCEWQQKVHFNSPPKKKFNRFLVIVFQCSKLAQIELSDSWITSVTGSCCSVFFSRSSENVLGDLTSVFSNRSWYYGVCSCVEGVQVSGCAHTKRSLPLFFLGSFTAEGQKVRLIGFSREASNALHCSIALVSHSQTNSHLRVGADVAEDQAMYALGTHGK